MNPNTLVVSGLAMSIHLRAHAFAANPLRGLTGSPSAVSSSAAADALRSLLDGADAAAHNHLSQVLPFRRGHPLARSPDPPAPSSSSSSSPAPPPAWRLAWLPPSRVPGIPPDVFVFLGSHGGEGEGKEAAAYWAVDVSEVEGARFGGAGEESAFVDLRTLMVAADWRDKDAMGELAIAGHARALLEWHNTAKFCGACGAKAVPTEAGTRKQCSNESCKKRIYPRVDPVVIMLVIDKENDHALLSRQSRFIPRMWSCLAGFIEPGESLEEAVRRETWEETGIEVGQVIYHSSQPWPVGPNTMPCQLMVGFFAYAKSLEISVDKKELEEGLPKVNTLPEPDWTRQSRRTYLVTAGQIQSLERRIVQSQAAAKNGDGEQNHPPEPPTTYVAVASLLWTSIARAKSVDNAAADDDEEYFLFPADCRRRLQPPLEPGFFGNCIKVRYARATTGDLVCRDGDNDEGLARAAAAFRRAIREHVEEEDPLGDADRWVEIIRGVPRERLAKQGSSHRFMAYEVDFGWGQPSRVELVSVSSAEMTTLLGAPGGAVQVSVALHRDHVDGFEASFLAQVSA